MIPIYYYFFIVNKSGKIVTYAKYSNDNSNTTVNASRIPAAIKSVNATNWRFYNGDQLASDLASISLPDQLPQITHPSASYVIDCSSWVTVTLVDNPTTMSKLSNCESSTRYPNCIFVFYDYDEKHGQGASDRWFDEFMRLAPAVDDWKEYCDDLYPGVTRVWAITRDLLPDEYEED